MTACGASPQSIATELNLSLSELTTVYKDDLDRGLELANARVAKVFFDMATSGEHPTLTMKWMELRGGWTPSSSINVTDHSDAELARDKLLKLMNRSTASKVTTLPLKVAK
jgi:hypothetical protein